MATKTYICKVHGEIELYITLALGGKGPFCPDCIAEWFAREVGEPKLKEEPEPPPYN